MLVLKAFLLWALFHGGDAQCNTGGYFILAEFLKQGFSWIVVVCNGDKITFCIKSFQFVAKTCLDRWIAKIQRVSKFIELLVVRRLGGESLVGRLAY